MSDTQRDREERQHVIEVLKSWDGYFIGYTSDEVQEALRYAIASIKTDLKYDLLYEGVDCNNCKNNWHRGDGSTYCATGDGICHYECEEPTTKNNLGVDCISRTQAIERLKLNFPISQGADNSRDRHRYMQAQADLQAIRELPSVTPQEPILDKIRAEIEQLHLIGYAIVDGKREIASRAVMQIIDKYKAESEG